MPHFSIIVSGDAQFPRNRTQDHKLTPHQRKEKLTALIIYFQRQHAKYHEAYENARDKHHPYSAASYASRSAAYHSKMIDALEKLKCGPS